MARSPRIAHLLSADLWAGAEAATCQLLSALSRRDDLRVEALLLNEGEAARRLRDAGLRVHVVPEKQHGTLALLRSVRAVLAGFDLVHAHDYKECVLAALSGRPWLATQHGRREPHAGLAAWKMYFYLAAQRLALRSSARRVIAVSDEVDRWLADRVSAVPRVRIDNGIEDPARGAPPAPWSERPRRVGVLARLVPVKRIELAIDAVAAVRELELEIVGEGPLRATLEARVAASGAGERIRLVGFDTRPTPRLAGWRALLVTSHHEGSPVSVIESLALGTPVVAADLPGVEAMLAGRGGLLIRDPHPDAWARALELLVDDDERGERLSREGRERFLAAFTAEHCAERTAGVYGDILTQALGAPSNGSALGHG
jgi:glycosyltransferase involved in cell wall biosynthesis